MQVVTFSTASGLLSELLLPMRLIAYNGGSRRLMIGGETRTLPAPIVAWLQGSSQYGSLIVGVSSASAETALPAIKTPTAESEIFEL